MAGVRTALVLALGISAAALGACDNGPSAVSQQAAGTQMAQASAPERAPAAADGAQVDHRKDPAPLLDGKPLWSSSRRASAQDNAERAFARNGEAFGASSLEAFVRKAHAFVDHPPAGTQTLTRANGDTLFYDPKGNVFAVADKAGTPRAMFKPDSGATYWQEQKDREARRQTARAGRHNRDDDA